MRGQYAKPGSPQNIHGGMSQLSTVQGFAAGGEPNFVTIGIGGNDANFEPIIEKCMRDSCVEDQVWMDGILNNINGQVHDDVRATYEELRSSFPEATIAGFGYPSVIGDPAKDCGGYRFLWARIEEDERRWLKETVFPALNQSLRDAALEAGVTFIDISTVTKGHEICAKHPWINGLQMWSEDTGNIFKSESFHPNELAHDAIGRWFMRNFVSDGRLVFENPTPTEVIDPPAGTPISMGRVETGVYGENSEQFCVQACPLTIQGAGYQPGATVELTLQGAPIAGKRRAIDPVNEPLDAAIVADDGTFSVVRQLPNGVAPGTYTVSVSGDAPDGSPQYGTSFLKVYAESPGEVGVLNVDVKRLGKPRIRGLAVTAK